jgi:hypothetical protein
MRIYIAHEVDMQSMSSRANKETGHQLRGGSFAVRERSGCQQMLQRGVVLQGTGASPTAPRPLQA